MGKRTVFLIFLFTLGILSYGYWASRTHGYFYLTLATETQKILNAQVQFLDKQGSVLAEGHSDNTYGLVTAKHPEAGYCDSIEKQAPFSAEARKTWKVCFDEQVKWVIKWAPKVKFLNIASANCTLHLLPVNIRTYTDDWWLWWVPLPHIGGSPLTSFHFDIKIEAKNECP